ALQFRSEFIPGPRIAAQRNLNLGLSTGAVPSDRKSLRPSSQIPGARLASGIANPDLKRGRLRRKVWEDLSIVDPHRAVRAQPHSSNETIPVPLGMIAYTVRPFSNVDQNTIVDPDSDRVFTRPQSNAQIVNVRHRQTVVGSERPSIQPGARLPMRPF